MNFLPILLMGGAAAVVVSASGKKKGSWSGNDGEPCPASCPGMVSTLPQAGHFTCLPARSSPVRSNLSHWVQRNWIAMRLALP